MYMEGSISSPDRVSALPGRLLDEEPWLPENATVISSKAWLLPVEGTLRVFVGQVLLCQFAPEDKVGRDYAIAQLWHCRYATQEELARAFEIGARTVRRLCRRLEGGGVEALKRKERSDKTPGAVAARACTLRAQGLAVPEIGRRTGLSPRTVRAILEERGHDPSDRALRQLVVQAEEGEQAPLVVQAEEGEQAACPEGAPGASAAGLLEEELGEEPPELGEQAESGVGLSSEEGAGCGEGADAEVGEGGEEPAGRGAAGEADVHFTSAGSVGGAGVLLALAGCGPLLSTARRAYGNLQEGVYGLRATLLGLVVMALLRVKSAESLKGKDPEPIGQVLGLKRFCEMKTLRRKLSEMARQGQAAAWHKALARGWVAADEAQIGVLYVDGHTRAYFGKERVAKGWCSRRRICLPAASETWVNDARGEPLLRISAEGHPGLAQVLPEVVAGVKEIIGERKATVVFDRGGWSGETFRQVREAGFEFTTYYRGKWEPWPGSAFSEYRVREGKEEEKYELAQGRVKVSGYGEARVIVRRCEDGKQIAIVTSKEQTPILDAAIEMFGRWQQENFFKYMRAEYGLDVLVEYGSEAPAEREIPNPARQAKAKELQKARSSLKGVQAKYGRMQLGEQCEESDGAAGRGKRKGKGAPAKRLAAVAAEVAAAGERVAKLSGELAALPKRVLLSETERAQERVLPGERKLITDVVKMTAYRAECELMRKASPHFTRNAEEGHAFVRMVLAQPAQLRVAGETVEVIFRPLSAPRYTRALLGICEDVNSTEPHFPESPYCLHFTVAGESQTGHVDDRPCQEF